MQQFWSRVEIDHRNYEWSPKIHTHCPICGLEISFYSQMRDNECSNCASELPFPSRMAKDQEKRVEYHVLTETEPTVQNYEGYMYLREGD